MRLTISRSLKNRGFKGGTPHQLHIHQQQDKLTANPLLDKTIKHPQVSDTDRERALSQEVNLQLQD